MGQGSSDHSRQEAANASSTGPRPPVVILVGTSHPGNVGAVARGAANFGVEELRFVAPRCDVKEGEAMARAKHARHLLEQAKVYGTLEAAIADIGLSVGTTARTTKASTRFLRKPDDVRDWVANLGQTDTTIGVVFGREDSGLTADEVNALDQLVTIPTADYSSLNLAHAVTLVCYELFRAGAESRTPERTLNPDTIRVLHEAFDALTEVTHEKPWVRESAQGLWRKVVGRSQPDDSELHAILGVFTRALKRFNHPDFATERSHARLQELGLLVEEEE